METIYLKRRKTKVAAGRWWKSFTDKHRLDPLGTFVARRSLKEDRSVQLLLDQTELPPVDAFIWTLIDNWDIVESPLKRHSSFKKLL